MKTNEVKSVADAKNATPQKSDTVKGVAALAIVEAKKVEETPLQQRLKKVSEIQQLSNRRKVLVDAQNKLNGFEEGLDGEEEIITLGSGRDEIEITKPDAVKKVTEFLKNDVQQSLQKVDAELLTITL